MEVIILALLVIFGLLSVLYKKLFYNLVFLAVFGVTVSVFYLYIGAEIIAFFKLLFYSTLIAILLFFLSMGGI